MHLIICDPIEKKPNNCTKLSSWVKWSGLSFLKKTDFYKQLQCKVCDTNTNIKISPLKISETVLGFLSVFIWLQHFSYQSTIRLNKAYIMFPSHCSATFWSSNSMERCQCWHSGSDWEWERIVSPCPFAGQDEPLEPPFDLCITSANYSGCVWISDLCQMWRGLTETPCFPISSPTSSCPKQGK